MKTTALLSLATLALTGVAMTNPASAAIDANEMSLRSTTALAATATGEFSYELARRGRGGDDAPGDTRRGRGTDDPAGDDKGGRGRGSDDVASGPSSTGDIYQLARRGRGGDDRGGDDRGGRGRGSDDRGGARSGGDRNDDSGSGRSRPRIPGGSGCDDAGDIAEHSACSG